jgi:hypothetical protein
LTSSLVVVVALGLGTLYPVLHVMFTAFSARTASTPSPA